MDLLEWDARTYDALPLPHRQWGAAAIAKLGLTGNETVLDLGCGTGRDAEMLLGLLPHGHVIAVDGSKQMLAQARLRLGPQSERVTLLHADIRKPMILPQTVDAVLSVATLHWLPDHAAVFSTVAAALSPGGRFVAEGGGEGNLAIFRAAVAEASGIADTGGADDARGADDASGAGNADSADGADGVDSSGNAGSADGADGVDSSRNAGSADGADGADGVDSSGSAGRAAEADSSGNAGGAAGERLWNFATVANTSEQLRRAGFGAINVRLVPHPTRLERGEQLEAFIATVLLGAQLQELPSEQRRPFVRAVAARLPEPVIDYVRLQLEAIRL